MKISRLELQKLEIPFTVAFKHAAATRAATEAVLATAFSENGNKGFGEGCPRNYVTGETTSSAENFFANHKESISRIDGVEALRQWVSDHADAIDKNPAAWCAIEIALFDLLGQEEKRSIEQLLHVPAIQGVFNYSAVLGIAQPGVFQAQLSQYAALGFTDFKMKISGDAGADKKNIGAIAQALGAHARIRLDANNLWDNAMEAANYLRALGEEFWAVEEPLKPGDYEGLSALAAELGCRIILDESFKNRNDLDYLRTHAGPWVPNIRISKMGGLLRTLHLADECKRIKMPFILGAQVGETSILSRAALCVANAYRDHVLAQEGAFGTYLLKTDIADPPIQFGKNGVIENPLLGPFGLGLKLGQNP